MHPGSYFHISKTARALTCRLFRCRVAPVLCLRSPSPAVALWSLILGAHLLVAGCRPFGPDAAAVAGRDATAVDSQPEADASAAALLADAPDSTLAPTFALRSGARYRFENGEFFDAKKLLLLEEQRLESTELPSLCPAVCEARVHYQLDAQALRSGTRARRLARLLPEDQELAPGLHQLFAARLEGSTWTLQRAPLRVVPRGRAQRHVPPSALEQHCQLLLPSGTYNGQETRSLELLAVAWGQLTFEESASAPERDGLVFYRVHDRTRSLLAEGSAPLGTSMVLDSPPAGDLSVTARCSFSGVTVESEPRTITLNPELGLSPPAASANSVPAHSPGDADGRVGAASDAELQPDKGQPSPAEKTPR